jgi:hypothetical protein
MCQTQDSARYWCRIGNGILDHMSKSQILNNSTYILEDDCFSNNPSICHIFHQYDRRSVKIHHYCPFFREYEKQEDESVFPNFWPRQRSSSLSALLLVPSYKHRQLHPWDDGLLYISLWVCIEQICQFVLVFLCLKSNTQAICFC